MRKLFLSAFVLLLSVSALMAQDGADALKAAKKAFDKFTLSQDAEAVVEAATLVDKAFMSDEVKNDPKLLNTAAPIFAGYYSYYLANRSPEGAEAPVIENAMGKAADAYIMGFNKSDKKGMQKTILKGLTLIQTNLSNQGKVAYQNQEYDKANKAFAKSIMVDQFLTDNGGTSFLLPAQILDEKYFAGLTALLGNDFAGAKPYYEELLAAKYDDASIYDGLSKIAAEEKDMDQAAKYLEDGRTAFPDDKGLLFSQINLYLQQGKLETLMGSLDEGIDADPENPSLYLVKSQTFESLYNQSLEAGTPDDAKFDQAIATLETGLEKVPGNGKLIYALGLLEFNRGATMSQELQTLADDLSKEGQKKYDAMLLKVDAQFEKALPYFQQSEMANPNDPSTLQALRSMYARKDEIKLSNEFKDRLETIEAGGTIEKSYFKEKGM